MSFAIVFFDAPVIRTVARIEQPSTRHRTIAARLSVSSLFILVLYSGQA